MQITTKALVQNLRIKINSFYKVLNRCGFSKTNLFSLNDLIKLRDCIKTKHSKSKLLIIVLDKQIEVLKASK
jgi:hypothetical protein